MSVFKRGNIFYTDFVINGQRVCKSTGKTTKREAKHVEALERQKLLSGTKEQRVSKLLLHDAIEQVYDSKWKNNKDGIGSYRRARLLLENMGNVVLVSVVGETVDNLIRKLERTGIESSTVNRYLATLKTILKHFRLPADFIRLRKENKGRIRVLSKDEELKAVELLLGAEQQGKKPYYTEAADLVIVLVDTGMRLSEALNLIIYKDVSFQNNLISIWVNKGNRPRSIPMTSRVRLIMEERNKRRHDIYTKPFSITKHEAERAWQWVRTKMGLERDSEFVIHALRHTCASRLVNAGVDLYVVKEWLGHSSIQMTEKYAHLAPGKLVTAMGLLEGIT